MRRDGHVRISVEESDVPRLIEDYGFSDEKVL
jgi:hypothetical protein